MHPDKLTPILRTLNIPLITYLWYASFKPFHFSAHQQTLSCFTNTAGPLDFEHTTGTPCVCTLLWPSALVRNKTAYTEECDFIANTDETGIWVFLGVYNGKQNETLRQEGRQVKAGIKEMFRLYYGITSQLSPTKAVLFPDFFKSSKTWSDDKSVFTITFFPGRSISKLAIPSGDKTKKWTFVKSWEIFPLNVKCQCKWFLLTTISWGLQSKTGLGIQSFFYCACSRPEPTDWECYNVVASFPLAEK